MKHPNPKKHQLVSFIKSGMRILGYAFILIDITIAVELLILSEVTGIIEEMV